MRRATVALVMPNYNHARFLPTALDAVFAQTRPFDEVLVLDDASTDDSLRVIESYAARHPALRVLRNDRNRGVARSVNRLLKEVRSDYLVSAAADDCLRPQFLEKSMAALERHPEAGLCFSETTQLLAESGITQRLAEGAGGARIFDLSDLPEFCRPVDLIARMKKAYLPIASNTVVMKRDALLAVRGFPSELEWFADSFACNVIALRHGACVLPETLALIRALPGSYSQAMNDPARQSVVLRRMLDLLATPEYRDIRRIVRRCPSGLTTGRNLIFRVLAGRPRDWDLLASYLGWRILQHKRYRRLNALGILVSAALHLPFVIPSRWRRRIFPERLREAGWRLRNRTLSRSVLRQGPGTEERG